MLLTPKPGIGDHGKGVEGSGSGALQLHESVWTESEEEQKHVREEEEKVETCLPGSRVESAVLFIVDKHVFLPSRLNFQLT